MSRRDQLLSMGDPVPTALGRRLPRREEVEARDERIAPTLALREFEKGDHLPEGVSVLEVGPADAVLDDLARLVQEWKNLMQREVGLLGEHLRRERAAAPAWGHSSATAVRLLMEQNRRNIEMAAALQSMLAVPPLVLDVRGLGVQWPMPPAFGLNKASDK